MGWHLPKGDDFLPHLSINEVRQHYERERGGWPKIRLLIVVKRKEGQPMDAIAEQLNVSRTAVNETLHRFIEKGLAAKDAVKKSGRPKELSRAQLNNLRKRLISGPRKGQNPLWTTKMVMAHVEKKYQQKYTARHMRRLLRQLGFSVQKPRPRHYKADLEKQAHFKKTSEKHLENTGNGASQFFVWTRPSSQ
jgi:transposase